MKLLPHPSDIIIKPRLNKSGLIFFPYGFCRVNLIMRAKSAIGTRCRRHLSSSHWLPRRHRGRSARGAPQICVANNPFLARFLGAKWLKPPPCITGVITTIQKTPKTRAVTEKNGIFSRVAKVSICDKKINVFLAK